jgi:hypothetical protein
MIRILKFLSPAYHCSLNFCDTALLDIYYLVLNKIICREDTQTGYAAVIYNGIRDFCVCRWVRNINVRGCYTIPFMFSPIHPMIKYHFLLLSWLRTSVEYLLSLAPKLKPLQIVPVTVQKIQIIFSIIFLPQINLHINYKEILMVNSSY